MCVPLLTNSEAMPYLRQTPQNWQRICLSFLIQLYYELAVATLVAKVSLFLVLARLLVHGLKAKLMKQDSVSQTLHDCIEEASVAVIHHWEGYFGE